MKQKIFNVVVYSMLAYSIMNAGYIALPVEYQELIPQWNQLVALVSGGSTLLMGLGGLTVQNYLNNAREKADQKFNLLAQNYLNLERKYDVVENTYKSLVKSTDKQTHSIERLISLVKVDLQAKLSNPLIDSEVQKLIEGVIKDE